ncbi:MAG: LCP family protein [Actinomycetes bacterium]
MSQYPDGWFRDDPAPPPAQPAPQPQAAQRSTLPPELNPRGPQRPPKEPRRRLRMPRMPGGGYGGRRRWPRILLAVVVALVLLLLALLLYVNASLQRIDALPASDARPADNPGTDYLIVGSDSRAGLSKGDKSAFSTGRASGRRADTIMLMHTGSNGTTLVSLPRDSYVPIPGEGHNKLNAAYAFGGPQLLTKTVENVSGVRLDHYVEVDFRGFVDIVDAVGGVRVCPDTAISDKKAGINLRKGCQEVEGGNALGYVRARYSDPRGDLGRVERQQEFLAGLSDKVAGPSVLANPFAVWGMTSAGLDSVRVDEGDNVLDLLRFALAMRSVSGGSGITTTVPIENPDYRVAGVGSSVKWARADALRLFDAFQADEKVPRDILPPKG